MSSLLLLFSLVKLLFSQNVSPPLTPSPLPIVQGITTEPSATVSAMVTRVIDGDTIEVEMAGKKHELRYIGIDTPETVHPNRPVECFGKEASAKNGALVEGQKILLEKDVSETDRYGRLLRYVYLQDGTFINKILVEKGYATAATFPPDIKYQNTFSQAEQSAREQSLGLWSACQTTISPKENNDTCNIKGNINSAGDKIYHLPSQKYYNSTQIQEGKGEKMFCSESEAIEAGWRKALQ